MAFEILEFNLNDLVERQFDLKFELRNLLNGKSGVDGQLGHELLNDGEIVLELIEDVDVDQVRLELGVFDHIDAVCECFA